MPMKMNIGSTLSVQSETARNGAVDRVFIVAGVRDTAETAVLDGTEGAMATGTDGNRSTSIMAMDQAPPTAAVGRVNRPITQTATSPNPMVRASAPGRSRREPEGRSVCDLPVASGGRAAESVF